MGARGFAAADSAPGTGPGAAVAAGPVCANAGANVRLAAAKKANEANEASAMMRAPARAARVRSNFAMSINIQTP